MGATDEGSARSAKLDAVTKKVGYPEKWKDYSALRGRPPVVPRERGARQQLAERLRDREAAQARWIAPSGT